ncbi:MAG: YtoQ family protein [bacterium]|nr:YtoQ family protein [bacterium]
MAFRVYLAGEIHSDWRDAIRALADRAGLDIEFTSPVTDHAASDEAAERTIGHELLGEEPTGWVRDHASAKVNAIRTRHHIRNADLVMVRFAGKYREWNAALDAGQAVALGKPLVVLHDPELTHALKEVDAAALAVARTPEQAVKVLEYVLVQG